MVDAQANIKVNVDSSAALAELKALEKQIQIFNRGIVQGTAQASKFQNEFATSLIHNINATGKFTASMGMVHTETEKFSTALEKNQLSAREYFRYSMASTKSFGKLFGKEFGTITKTAEERVKLLQTRHIELGRAADGAMRAVKIVPTSLDYKQPITQMQMAIQKQQIFNQLLDTGTTKLLNFGKNTQWAGRQLMVGFTIPLTILGGAAIKTFRTMEDQAIRFKKVYGDMFTGQAETDKALENIQKLGQEFTKYGITVADTIRLAADAAAAGNAGKQLEDIVEQTTKLAILGDLTSDQAFDATIAIQNAFRLTGKELEEAVNFLNAVENQTVVALDDITEAIPRVASVVSVLGGDIKDLAIFMAAMKEGGIQASDGANALKTSLGRLINPTKAAVKTAADLGINLRAIVDENAGDLGTIMQTFAVALKPLDDLSKARLMERVFGKFQFARMTTLFNNLGRSGTQAARAMDLAGQSTESLAMLAEKELGVVADSAATKFAASMEKLKVSLAPLGEELIKLITPFADLFTKLLEKFNDLSDGSKKVITGILVGLGAIGPVVLMGIGLFANGIANLLKFINLLRKSYQNLTMGGQSLGMSTNYLTTAQLEALSVANNLHSVHERLTDRFALEAGALSTLITKYREATIAASGFLGASGTRGMFVPGTRGRFGAAAPKTPPIPMADGGFVPGTGNKDTVPAMLMPGEFVVTKKATKENSQILKEMNKGGGTFRSAGTPAFGKMEFRIKGTESIDKNIQSTSSKNKNNLMNKDDIKRHFGLSSKPSGLRVPSTSIFGPEERAIKNEFKKQGLTVTTAQFDNLVKNNQLSHIKPNQVINDPDFGKVKIWDPKNLLLDKGYVNNYMNGMINKPGFMELARLNDVELSRVTGMDSVKARGILNGLGKGIHPTSRDQARVLLEVAKRGNNYTDIAARVGLQERLKGNFYETKNQRKITWKSDAAKNRATPAAIQRKLDQARAQIPVVSQRRVARGKTPIEISGSTVSPRTSSSSRPVASTPTSAKTAGRFGAAKGIGKIGALFGAAAVAQSFLNRSLGTPAYGEPRATQAMLTPGEFVVNSRSAQKFGPALQAMNEGGVVYRQTPPNIPGYVERPSGLVVPASSVSQPVPQTVMKQTTKAQVAYEKIVSRTTGTIAKFGSTITPVTRSIDKLRFGATDLTKEQKKEAKERKNLNKLNAKENQTAKRAAMNARLSGAGSIAMVGSMIAMGVGQASKDEKTSQTANSISQVLMAVSVLGFALPILTKAIVAVPLAIAAIPAAIILYNMAMKKAADEGARTVKSLGVTADELEKVAESTGRIGLSQIGKRQEEERLRQFTPMNADFGTEYMDSDAGKMLLDQIKEFEKQGIDSSRQIAIKLATFVADGLMEASEAQGIIAELGRQMGSTTFAIKLSGQLTELIGFDGTNLNTDPMTVRVKIVEEVEASTSEFIASTTEELERLQNLGRFKRGSFAALEAEAEGKNRLQMNLASIDAFFFGLGKAEAKLSGAIVGQANLLVETTQQQILGGKVELQTLQDQYDEQEKILNAQLSATTDAGKRLEIEKELEKLQDQRAFNEKSFAENNEKLNKMQRLQLSNLTRDFQFADEANQKLMTGAAEKSVRERFKGTAEEGTANKLLATVGEFEDKTIGLKINTLIASDSLSVGNASSLLEMFTEEGDLNREINTMIRLQNVEGLNRALQSLAVIEDSEVSGKLFNEMSDLDPAAFDAANKFLETASGIPSPFLVLNDDTVDFLTADVMKEAGEDLEKIEEQLKDLDKFSGEERITKIMDFVTNDDDFAVLQGEAEYFNSLDDVNVKQFLSIFRVISEDFDTNQAKLDFMNLGGTEQSFTALQREGKTKDWWIKNVAVPRAKEFQRLIEDIKLPGLEGEDDPSGGASKSLPITMKQLIELRLKGLDPAAASSLDYETAAKVLNGTIKQQKKAIALLNEELRESSIRAQLLKTDEEVLEDTLKATTSAISAYINMIEQTRVKPIQDQIDAFNDLTDAQSEQIEKYQKGLQSLSDKEDKINKIYDERIDAIDKVADANERSAQRSQRQISLASAIASGDFAAAAAAQAEITAAEAENALDDTRAALEERRQQELKDLVIEVNGQLFTREQIETNIKNIEEEIYQRTLLIRQEQEKIAEIEKQITAEKEKQRKIQALQQIMSISQQLRTTVDPQQRQLMQAEMGFIGQSVGVSDLSNQGQFTQLGQELGVNLTGFSNNIAKSIRLSEQTSLEMITATDSVRKNTKNIEKFMNDGSLAASNALGFLQTLNNSWSDKKTGLTIQGSSVRDSMISAATSLVKGSKILEETIKNGLRAIGSAAAAAAGSVSPSIPGRNLGGVIERPLGGLIPYMGGGKVLERPLGGLIPYMGGGRVKKYALGGNVNYKGSRESAPVKMNLGSMVTGSVAPGLGNLDRVPALLTPGEFVVRKSVAQENMPFLRALNKDVFPQFDSGMDAGSISPVSITSVTGGTNLYNNNYSVSVNVSGSDNSPNDIANVVVRKLKTMNDRNIRGSKF